MSDIFDHYCDAMEDALDGRTANGYAIERRDPQCNRCRSTDVRWRQQGGKWVLFSLTPGQVHTCEIDASEFGAVAE